jgi:hypothetical protein
VHKATFARVSLPSEPSDIVALKINVHKCLGSIKGRNFLDQQQLASEWMTLFNAVSKGIIYDPFLHRV